MTMTKTTCIVAIVVIIMSRFVVPIKGFLRYSETWFPITRARGTLFSQTTSRRFLLLSTAATAAALSRNNSTSSAQCAAQEDEEIIMQPFEESCLEFDHYNGVTLNLEKVDNSMPKDDFASALKIALMLWKQEGRKGVWIHCPDRHADKVPIATDLGFKFHMVSNGSLILTQWLPDDTPSRLPIGPTHQVGVGCVILHPHDNTKMLVVQEKTGPAAAYKLWKMPTGLADPKEDVHDAAVRELKEETGLDADFGGILVFRQAHTSRSGSRASSDLFFVCRMHLKKDVDLEDLKACPEEIEDIRWMPVQDYCDQELWQKSPVYQELNKAILMASQHSVFGRYTLPLGFIDGSATNTLYKSQS